MSVDIGLFGPPQSDEEELHPDFNKVLLGFDPRHVEEFVQQTEDRIAQLEKQVRDARAHADAANRRAGSAREEAYGEIAGRMAELLRAADHQAEKLRRDTDEACHRQLAEAAQEAEQIRREAEARADALRGEGEMELASAKGEARRVLGELARHRDALIGELQSIRSHLIGLVERVEIAVEAPDSRETQAEAMSALMPTMAPGVDDLLDSTSGFDLAPMVVWEDTAAPSSYPASAERFEPPPRAEDPVDELPSPRVEATVPELAEEADEDDAPLFGSTTEVIDLTYLGDEEIDAPAEPADPASAD